MWDTVPLGGGNSLVCVTPSFCSMQLNRIRWEFRYELDGTLVGGEGVYCLICHSPRYVEGWGQSGLSCSIILFQAVKQD